MRKFSLSKPNLSTLSRWARMRLGLDSHSSTVLAGRGARAGVVSSVVFLLLVAAWMALAASPLILGSVLLASLATLILAFSLNRGLTLSRANLLALMGHLCALFSFYFFYTRMVNVTYVTDSIVGTYMGVVRVLQLQNPYSYSIKSLLDQLGFPPSFYTPRVDGSFEFHLNYPALNFLSLIPMYLAGLHDLRDGVMVFHLVSVLAIFSLVPPRLKALSLAPFAFGFPLAIGYSWTDSIWAFFVLLTAVLWYRNKGLSLVSLGLAAATKQIAFVAAPFLLIRLWNEEDGSKLRGLVKGSGFIAAGFLVPNVPFIIASPSSWWAGTIGPYLPSRTPLIPGGIGFSEILPDVGFVISPVFFSVLTVIVVVSCLVALALSFNRLNRFIWAMPALVLFFYPRSLPNYIVYWAFPYFFEWFKYGNPQLSLSQLLAVVNKSWNQPGWSPLGGLRRRVGPAVLVGLVLTTALVGASEAYVVQVSRPKVDVRVDQMADPDSLGVATRLAVTITNSGPDSISPSFFVKWFFLWDLWRANQSGILLPASRASYVLTATDALAGIPRGSTFHVAVYDSGSGQLAGQSPSYLSNLARPPVANPRFTWWTLDVGAGRQVPFSWKLSLFNLDRTEGGIGMLDMNSSSGVRLRLNSTIDQQTFGEVVLSQRLLFNETNLNILVRQPPPTDSLRKAVLGMEATDGTHILYFLFSTGATETRVISFPENTTVTVPTSDSSWSLAALNIQLVWLGLGWTPSNSLEVSLFLRSSQGGLFMASIQQANLAPNGLE